MSESPQDESPTGLPADEEDTEGEPLGVPEPDPDGEGEPRRGEEAMPGIPDRGDPPAAS